jgi:hypothetical protein
MQPLSHDLILCCLRLLLWGLQKGLLSSLSVLNQIYSRLQPSTTINFDPVFWWCGNKGSFQFLDLTSNPDLLPRWASWACDHHCTGSSFHGALVSLMPYKLSLLEFLNSGERITHFLFCRFFAFSPVFSSCVCKHTQTL